MNSRKHGTLLELLCLLDMPAKGKKRNENESFASFARYSFFAMYVMHNAFFTVIIMQQSSFYGCLVKSKLF